MLRVPPHSVEAEQGLLGGLLLDNRGWERCSDLLAESDFYRHEHRVIFAAVNSLVAACKPADVLTVYERLQTMGKAEDAGGMQYLHALAVGVPSASNVRRYAEIVRERSLRRRLVALSDEIATAAFNPQGPDVAQIADRYAQALLELAQGTAEREPRRVGELLPAWLDELQELSEGKSNAISTGWADVDDKLAGGLRRGELVTLAARPSMGKSAWMGGLARQVARLGPVLVCSLEDSDRMFVTRQVASLGRVNLAHLRRPDAPSTPASMWQGVEEGTRLLGELPLYIDDAPALSVHEVRHKALQVRGKAKDLLLVVVDYLQLMEGEGDHRAQQLAGIARGLKHLAKSLNCAVLVLSQLNREADKVNGPPRLDHLAETDGLEQASDIVGLLWREHRRKPTEANKHSAQVEFAKNKNGPTAHVKQWFDGATQRFEDGLREEQGDGT